MDKLLIVWCILVGFAMIVLAFPLGMTAVFLTVIVSFAAIGLIHKYAEGKEEKTLVTRVFLAALLVRLIFGLFVHVFDLHEFFGGDAETYNDVGYRLLESWFGPVPDNITTTRAMITTGPGWTMKYLVAGIYLFSGENILAGQSVCAVIGAATAPLTYFCTKKIFNNGRASIIAALAIALFPAFIIWTSQMLKDGLMVFFLVLTMTLVLRLQEKFSVMAFAILIFSLFAIITLRFYIFYMVVIAISSSFIIGMGATSQSIAKRLVVVCLLALALAYIGILRTASVEFEEYGNLERIQESREDLSRGGSGFGVGADVSTTGGALAVLPVGFVYLMLAPFPWQINTFRAALTVPDILLWWSSIPFLIIGLLFTFKHRLKKAIPIMVFTILLTLSYSLFQGNVGTAYRQRIQIQVFLFIFIAVGLTIVKERKENKAFQRKERMKQFYRNNRGRD
jgi:4-amino-4-deoxy-L-arabinose transferase-like glycosyltransferase